MKNDSNFSTNNCVFYGQDMKQTRVLLGQNNNNYNDDDDNNDNNNNNNNNNNVCYGNTYIKIGTIQIPEAFQILAFKSC